MGRSAARWVADAASRMPELSRRATAVLVVVTLPVLVSAAPQQEDVPDADSGGGVAIEVDIDIDVSIENHEAIDDTLDDLEELVSTQLDRFDEAEGALDDVVVELADVDANIMDLNLLIEGLTEESDEVVTSAYINPPAAGAVDLLTTETVSDLALKQALLNVLADHDGDVLAALSTARSDLEDELLAQEELQVELADSHGEALDALADLEAALSAEAQFVLAVQGMLDNGEGGEVPGELVGVAGDLQDRLTQIEADTAAEREQRELEERAQEQAGSGSFVCPVQPTSAVSFSDTWGAARSGGRSHQGTDMMAAHGTATVAPVDGRVEHRGTSLGGLSWYLYGDNGDTYYGTHLQSYDNQGAGWVAAGTVIGAVGSSGNATADAPHLHFEHHPGGGAAVNPYQILAAAC